jgi:hypothetical protein
MSFELLLAARPDDLFPLVEPLPHSSDSRAPLFAESSESNALKTNLNRFDYKKSGLIDRKLWNFEA